MTGKYSQPVVEPRPALDVSSPFKTKYDQQSQFDPNATDPVTGLKGAITHPKGAIGKRDLNNFQPRLGLAWNFHPKWVFRILVRHHDRRTTPAPGGFDEYAGNFNILQPTGDPRQVFQLSDGPGPIHYTVNADGTVSLYGRQLRQPQRHLARPEPAQPLHHELVRRLPVPAGPTPGS